MITQVQKKIQTVIAISSIILIICVISSCTRDKIDTIDHSQYPPEVAAILVNQCATAGCHNTQSAVNANGLDFSTWDNMFKGGKNGSSIIPYSVAYSYCLYVINNDTTDGDVAMQPRM